MLFDIDFNKALDLKHMLKEGKRIITKKVDMKNRNAYWDEYEYIRDYSGSVLNLVVWSGILKALIEAKGFITLGSPSYEDTILFMEDKLGNHNVISDFDYKELELLKESFRDLNQRLQRMGYKPIKTRYGWYWLKV